MKTITMSMEMFEDITDAMVCECCPLSCHNNGKCSGYKTCGGAIKKLIEKDNKKKGIETNESDS